MFISYSRTDRPYVDRLAVHLRAFGIDVWYDRNLEPGANFEETIFRELDTCVAVVLVLSPEAIDSRYVGLELERAADARKTVYPILLRPVSHVPEGLAEIQREDVTDERMPSMRFAETLRRAAEANDPAARQRRPPDPVWSYTRSDAWILDVAISPDGETIAAAASDGMVQLLRTADGSPIKTMGRYRTPIHSLAFLADGIRLVTSGQLDVAAVWDTKSAAPVLDLATGYGAGRCVVVSPSGAHIAETAEDGEIRLWDAVTGVRVQVLAGHKYAVYSVAFSPDGATLVSGGHDGTVRLWDLRSGGSVAALSGHNVPVHTVAWSPSGDWLASAGRDSSIIIWDAHTQQSVRVLKGHTDWVGRVAFSHDGSYLSSVGRDGTLRAWDAFTGAALYSVAAHDKEATSIAQSVDDLYVVTGGLDSAVRLWRTKSAED